MGDRWDCHGFRRVLVKATDLRTTIESYLNAIGECRTLSRGEEQALAVSAKAGDASARQRLIESNARWAVALAKKYQWTGIPLADLIQEANVGLINAVDSFSPDKGRRLTTLAARIISNRLVRLRYARSVISLPKQMPKREAYQEAFNAALSAPAALKETLVARSRRRRVKERDRARLERALALLPDMERHILEQRCAGATLAEIATATGLSQSRVQQLETSGTRQARKLAMAAQCDEATHAEHAKVAERSASNLNLRPRSVAELHCSSGSSPHP